MNEENQISYYSVIPATVRYDNRLKPAEKLIYSEITSLTNRMGYCFASNKYFANLYGVTIHTVSQWISHLEKLEYVYIELIRDTNKEIKERRIYINDTPYVINNSNKIPKKFYDILDRLEFLYTEEILNIMQKDKIQMLKEIIYILYEIYNSSFNNLLSQVKRESLINLYVLAQEHSPNDLLNYYKRTIINKYTNNST